MAKKSKQALSRLRTREDEEQTPVDERQEGTQVSCYNEVYSYGGKWYGPGIVTIKDPEAAEAVQKAIERVEGQKQAAEEARKKGVAHTPAQSTTHHWVRGDNVVAPIVPETKQFGDDEEDELEFRRTGTDQTDGESDDDEEESDADNG